MYELHLGDCLEVMATLPAQSVDMVLCDPPYGTTACKWDAVIPFAPMWEQLRRICKPRAAIVLTASQPFTSALVASNFKDFRYCWVWDKKFAGNFVQAARMPMKTHEDVAVFATGPLTPLYFPQVTVRNQPIKKGGNKPSEAIPIRQTDAAAEFGRIGKTYDTKQPTTIVEISSRSDANRGLHPTQKPDRKSTRLNSSH